ncbi:DUF2461 domain-containing protein [Fulvivirga lutea]|uniref:DUF2461 domain-containing protein n=1 Tax=Fulvivirga lutea TaxID=2810512 RepID=A0A974WJB8_9BACT|nr:DUF2461 domain-containing protein [Fulvivirga lutea]QSE98843.1 DUF2461 domain-containing protein [Fulvivirga lutea]
MSLSKETFTFLNDLSQNNNREWFNANKDRYVSAHEKAISFADELIEQMKKHDDIETPNGKKSLFRIYRDVRFSKDKSPYKNHFSGNLKRATKWLRGGYYFHLEPGNVLIAGGFFDPNKDDLLRIRQEIAADAGPLRDILNNAAFKKAFGTLQGDQLKTAPKGFDKDHPDIDLINYKNYYVVSKFSDTEALKPDFAQKVSERFQILRPYLNYFSEVLTTDENGLPIE